MYRLLIVSVLLFINGCTSCTNEETQKSIKKETSKKQEATRISATKPVAAHTVNQVKEKPSIDKAPAENPQENIEDMIEDIYPQIVKETKGVPGCLEAANTKEEALLCTKRLTKLNNQLETSTKNLITFDIINEKKASIWNEGTKRRIIEESNAIVKEVEQIQHCIDSNDPQKKRGCVEFQF